MYVSTEDPLAATPILPTRQPQLIPLGFHANLFQISTLKVFPLILLKLTMHPLSNNSQREIFLNCLNLFATCFL